MLVFSIDNRGTGGRGREFERVLLRRFGKIELEDQLVGGRLPQVAPVTSTASGSESGAGRYGGYMDDLRATNAPGVFRAGAAVAPVTNWLFVRFGLHGALLKLPAENADGLPRLVTGQPGGQAGTGALLLITARGRQRPRANSLQLADKLYAAGKPYVLQLYPNKNHGIPGNPARCTCTAGSPTTSSATSSRGQQT